MFYIWLYCTSFQKFLCIFKTIFWETEKKGEISQGDAITAASPGR